MPSSEETHAQELLGSSQVYAKRAVEILLGDERLKDCVPAPLRPAMMAEFDRFHLFLIFSSLEDKSHREKTFFQRVHKSLREQFLALEARRLIRFRDEISQMAEGPALWKELKPENDPLQPYYGSFDGGCRTLDDSPFGVVARRVSSRFFSEETAGVAYETVLSITLDTGDRVTKVVDEIRDAG
ncbi:MAG: hypothetical protein COB53_02010 [Elusimicrobia bacterium]|nr:MAG: hypothetical protein COB53_02010 [Elusimicrobiota bacterium]